MAWSSYNSSGAAKTTGSPTFVTSLPTGSDGQEVYYQADSSNGIIWHLRFRSVASGGDATYGWEYVGGGAMFSEVTTTQSTASTSYIALTTAGPTVTLPLAGDYIVTIGVRASNSGTGGPTASYDIGATGAVDADRITNDTPVTGGYNQMQMRSRRKNGLGAVSLTMKYKSSGFTSTFSDRFITVTPIRVG